jgi:YebC/PmpR family DNA-binding regulatory protein
MSGHSKWASIKHKKGKADAQRGQVFTKLIKEITVAARMGGGDPEGNARLRSAVATAKAQNMPGDNITRAIKKGTGELEGIHYEEFTYEGYGPGGVAVMVEVLTDNKNRTTADVRRIFTRNAGNLGEGGCVSWMFEKKGLILFDKAKATEDQLMEVALDAGAEDVNDAENVWEVITTAADFEKVKKAFDDRKMAYESAQLSMIPQTTVKLEGKDAEHMLKLMEQLEDSDDVQHVYANFDISLKEMEKLSA